jgi:hypothetical protein
MNTTDYLVSSDIASGVVALVMERLQNNVSNANMWRPFVENTVLSVVGRFGQSYLSQSWASSKDKDGKETPYVRTAAGRSGIIIYISDMVLQYVMKSKNKYSHSITAVAADALGNEIISATMATDTVLIAKKST